MKDSLRTILLTAFTLVLLLFMAGPVQALIRLSLDLDNKHASHIIMIPFITAALMYMNRRDIFSKASYSVVPGAAVLLLGAGVFVLGKAVGADFRADDQLSFTIASLVVMWLGGFLLFYGVAAFKSAIFPLLFLFFSVPIPTPILSATIAFLQRWSAETTYVLLKASGTPVFRQDFVFTFSNIVVSVAPECSGIRSGISLVITSLLAGHLLLRTLSRRSALLCAAIPVLIFKNGLRITTLSLLAVHVDPRILQSQLHQEGGIPFFVLGLTMLYPVLVFLIRSEKKAGMPAAPIVTADEPVVLAPTLTSPSVER